MRILFQRNETAQLPEIQAYVNYFNRQEGFYAVDSAKIDGKVDLNAYDVIWEFKGRGGIQAEDKLIVHEYLSLSTGKLPKLKNFIKSRLNPTPDLRVFLNENVRNGFRFKEATPILYRDMGIAPQFIRPPQSNDKKEYDFVYVGSISVERNIPRLLDAIIRDKAGSILLVGNPEDGIDDKYAGYDQITFSGKVAYEEVPDLIQKAEYALNFIPDKYPFNLQTSTKLLEYMALNMKVISTDYKWVQQFMHQHKSQFYTTDYKTFSLDMKAVQAFKFSNHFQAEDYLWDTIFENAQIKNQLNYLYEKKFLS